MEIFVTSGVGTGRTNLSAFDNALFKAGIANYNLLYLSSVIPPASRVIVRQIDRNGQEHGHKLYVVMSRRDQNVIGQGACAGIGWAQRPDGSGVFVEHSGECVEDVKKLITMSLEDMLTYRQPDYGKIHMKLSHVVCDGKPVTALVAAVYESQEWSE